MRLRPARPSDAEALADFDLGPQRTPWLDEVTEIVDGLISWRDSPSMHDRDRHVLVLEDDLGEIVAVAAHEAVVTGDNRAHRDHRYLMVTAVRVDAQRQGHARLLITSTIAAMQANGARTVTWLVNPRNNASIAFSRTVFPEADETYPPEDKPYAAFTLLLIAARSTAT